MPRDRVIDERVPVLRGVLLAGVVAASLSGACKPAPAEPPGPCSGLAERRLGITREEYRPCAAHLLGLLDELRPLVRAVVHGQVDDSEQAVADAQRVLDRLQTSFRQTGCERDFRSPVPGRATERFPDTHMRAFNSHVFQALFQYRTALQARSVGNLEQAEVRHGFARTVHALFR